MTTICVYGLWHLGTVTAACLAEKGFSVTGLDNNSKTVSLLQQGTPPLYEPGLEELVSTGLKNGKLQFSSNLADCSDADIIWVNLDTPVDDNDIADTQLVSDAVTQLFPHIKSGAVVLISSQLPAGSTDALQAAYDSACPNKPAYFAYSPENLRLGKAIQVFNEPERIVIGVNHAQAKAILEPVLSQYTENLLWMKVASAEMVKHSLNAFLATCITFINEIAEICEEVGADAAEVETGLRSEPRVGQKAYVKPGSAFAGGTLARDINYLNQLAAQEGVDIPLLGHVLASNTAHKRWIGRKLQEQLGVLQGKTIAVFGLAYTPGTDTLRRSFSVELCQWLQQMGAIIQAYDPNIRALPESLQKTITLADSMEACVTGADALVIANEHPEYKTITADRLVAAMHHPLVIDQNNWLRLEGDLLHSIMLGKPSQPKERIHEAA